METIRVVIVDDHAVVRAGVRSLLGRERDIDIVGEAGNAAQAMSCLSQHAADVVVLDIRLGDASGIDVCRRIKETHPGAAVILLSAYWDDMLVREALQAGANGYVVKDAERLDLTQGIRAVRQHETFFDPPISSAVMRGSRHSAAAGAAESPPRLSRQDICILELVGQGFTNKQIGERLHLSHHTVREHVSGVMSKLAARNRAEAAQIATRRGLI